ncbi:MAG: hypothetical protein LQ352_001119 [Teloschistes flavicans]|nr:MAG: hypothetical protein LQ352_001119 [Teloschistes flavicans]
MPGPPYDIDSLLRGIQGATQHPDAEQHLLPAFVNHDGAAASSNQEILRLNPFPHSTAGSRSFVHQPSLYAHGTDLRGYDAPLDAFGTGPRLSLRQ